jgi:hypothetical protein
MSHIFISYSKKDRDYARSLADHLLGQGFDVWIDDRIDFGEMWERVIFRAIDECGAFVVIMTPQSYESDWVLRECNYADRRKKPHFPLLLSGEEFPRYSAHQFVDVQDRTMPNADFTRKLQDYVPRKTASGKVITQDVKALPPSSERLGSKASVSSEYSPSTTDLLAVGAAPRTATPAPKRLRLGTIIIGVLIAVIVTTILILIGLLARNNPPATIVPTEAVLPSPTTAIELTSTVPAQVTSAPTPTLRAACANNLPLLLSVGAEARVTLGGGPLRLRDNPTLQADILAVLDEGTPMTVIGGPSCDAVNLITWWQVQTEDAEGWVVEGVLPDAYYVEVVRDE